MLDLGSLQDEVDAAATAESTEESSRSAIACLDLTSLNDDDDVAKIATLIDRARRHRPAAVCLYPSFVAQAVEGLRDTSVKIATVSNFPAGDLDPEGTRAVSASAVADGADEVDVVFPWRAFLSGDEAGAESVLTAARNAVEDRRLKVILETSRYPDADSIRRAARSAVRCGADFLKTSTGKVDGGATLETVALLWEAALEADRSVGVKASGGVKTADDAARFLDLGLRLAGAVDAGNFRFGASGLLDQLIAHLDGAANPEHPGGY